MKYDKLVLPVVKWVGGKRQLLSEIKKYVPLKYSTYYEPFIGGGALLFDLQPQKAVVNDVNNELINLYTVIRDNVDKLIEDLSNHKNESAYYYQIRSLDRDNAFYKTLSDVQRASRVHYLNKTCYNGLFRVNQAGQFNTPFGSYKKPNIVNEITIRAVSRYLNEAKITLMNTDYADSLKGIRKGSFVYFDPPYDPISSSSNFTGYASGGFDKEEQFRLKTVCDMLNKRGIKFLLSNSATPFIMDIYKDYNIEIIKAKRTINSQADKRGEINEVLVKNYE